MSLADGDYLIVAEKVVETLMADTGDGGLREEPKPPVKTIEPRIRKEAKLYSKYELPLIGVEVVRKREEPSGSSQLVDKIFEIEFLILCRGGDREIESERAKRIAGRLEKVLREQNLAEKQFSGLAGLIDASQGVLLSRVKESGFESRFFEDASGKNPEVSAMVFAEIIVPCSMVL